MDERLFWVGLTLVKGIGAARFKTLLEVFGDPQSAWEAPGPSLRQAGLPQKVVDHLLQARANLDLLAYWQRLEDEGITVYTPLDEAYPRRLKDIAQPPPVLYAKGEIIPQDEWAVAIVGTRRVTHYGQQMTEEIAAFLAASGVTVVSGLARGVDSHAHHAALNAGGRSIGVLGCGVDQIYPPENRVLAEKMIANGAVISDYPLGTPPEGVNFPPRNRIISGLSLASVIIEAGQRSGALITAQYAVEQGREVFALPGRVTDPHSKGTNRLIQKGAHPLLAPEDLIEALNLTLVTEQQIARQALPTNPTEAALFGVLGPEPTHIDEIGRQVDMPIEQVSAALALMELKGMVRQLAGMQYVAVREARARYKIESEENEDQ